MVGLWLRIERPAFSKARAIPPALPEPVNARAGRQDVSIPLAKTDHVCRDSVRPVPTQAGMESEFGMSEPMQVAA